MTDIGLMNDVSSYNPSVVIAAANARLAAGDWEGGQFLFQSSLLEWTDDAREAIGDNNDYRSIPEQQREAVATLWLAYAQYLVDAKQYKSATQAYADAVSSIVAGSVGKVHAAAARYALERNQRQTAVRIYRNALVSSSSAALEGGNTTGGGAVEDEQDRELLWHDFLEMMRTTRPNLTMAELRKAAIADMNSSSSDSQPPSKRHKTGESGPDASTSDHENMFSWDGTTSRSISPVPPSTSTTNMEATKTHVVTMESVQEMQTKILSEFVRGGSPGANTADNNNNNNGGSSSNSLPLDVTAAWLSQDGHSIPLEPPSPPLFRPAPPKLSDPTAKDVLGVDLAVELVQRLLSPSGGMVLEVCRALWMLQAWTEQTCRSMIESHDAALIEQNERLEQEWEARWSVAGTAATADAVAQMNERERQNFQWQASERRQQVVSQTVWTMRQLLCWQQQALAKLHVPGFTDDGITTMIDADSLLLQSYICQYLHSAFYIRNRMGSEPHETMLRSQLKKLLREQETGMPSGGNRSPKAMPAIPPGRQLSPIPPTPPTQQPQRPPMYTMNQPMLQPMPTHYAPGINVSSYPLQPQLQPMMQLYGMPQHGYPAPQQQQQQQQHPMMGGGQMMMGQQQHYPQTMQQQQQPYGTNPYMTMPPQSNPAQPPYGGPQYQFYHQQ